MKHIGTILCALGVAILSIAIGLQGGLPNALSIIGIALIATPVYIKIYYSK